MGKKLRVEAVREIKQLLTANVPRQTIAKRF